MAEATDKEQKAPEQKAPPATPEAAPVTPTPAPAVEAKRKKKGRREVSVGIAHIRCTFNNTIVTISDPKGNVIAWSSAGRKGFKGARKSTPFAAQICAEDAARKAADFGLRSLSVVVDGPGPGRETALRGLQVPGVKVSFIRDITPIPHNGCRPPKRRRV